MIILRLKILEAELFKPQSKLRPASTYIEAHWNHKNWTSKVSSGHTTPKWNESYVFESPNPSDLVLKLFQQSMFFSSQELGSALISADELFNGKAKEWIEISLDGIPTGKVLINIAMFVDKKTDQSTHNTSCLSVDLREEYIRKANELELEKEELEFYKRKYKLKLEKLSQAKKVYSSQVARLIKKATPVATEESSSEELEIRPKLTHAFTNKVELDPLEDKSVLLLRVKSPVKSQPELSFSDMRPSSCRKSNPSTTLSLPHD